MDTHMPRLIIVALLLTCSSVAIAAPHHIHLSWQGDTSTTMTVTWRSTAKSGTVQYGSTASYGKQVAAASRSYQGSYIHVAQITGLKAGSTTFYRCGVAGDWSAKYSFRTAPKAGTSFRYAAHGDSRSNDSARATVRAGVQARNPAFSVHTADFVSNGWSQSQWDQWFKTMQPLVAWSPLMGSIGNHEGHATNYYDQFAFPTHSPKGSAPGEAYFSFDYANTHFISVSTEHKPKVNDHQYKWLRADLIATAKKPHIKWIVAYGHRPPYSSGSHGNYTAARTAWAHLFESLGVDVTYWGHDHTYERTKPLFQGQVVPKGGVVYIVTGGAGAPLYTATGAYYTAVAKKLYHFCEVNVSGDLMKIEARQPNGTVFDTLTLTKKGPKPRWIMDGATDPGPKVLGTGGAELKNLRASFDGRYLYVATQGVPASKDHFVYLSNKKPTSLGSAPWKKGGKVWAHPLVLAMESKSGWSNWQAGSGQGAVPMGSVWKYHDSGKDLGTAWLGAGYNDSAWKSGPAQLGYGDNDEKTKLKNPNPNYPSVYFRKKVTLASVPAAATLKVVHDDGVAVWINGKLVYSKYVSKGTNYSAWASSQSTDNQLSTATVTQSGGGPFKAGTNIIAVMVKQVSSSSSDISFDLSLTSGSSAEYSARASNPAGATMEGFVDIKAAFGAVPGSVFLAAAAYGTSDGGGLSEQIPKGNGNGTLDLGEWIEFKLKATPPPDSGTDKTKPKDGPKPKTDGKQPPKDGPKSKTDGKQLPKGDGQQLATDGAGDKKGCSCSLGSRHYHTGMFVLIAGLLLLRRRRWRR